MVQTPPSPIVINHLCFSFAVFLEYWCFIFALSFEDKRSPWIPSPLLFPIPPRERLHFHRVNGKYPVCIQSELINSVQALPFRFPEMYPQKHQQDTAAACSEIIKEDIAELPPAQVEIPPNKLRKKMATK